MKTSFNLIIVGMLVTMPALGSISDDETSFKLLLMCGRVYKDPNNYVYEKDRSELSQISKAFESELKKKYSENDVNLLIGKSVYESSGMGFDTSKVKPVEACRAVLASLTRQKRETGTYLSRD